MKYKAGDIIDEYRLLSECGHGSYGTVFLAENQLTTGRSALKIIYKYGSKTDCELRGLLQYQIIAKNTNLLQIYQVKEYEDFFYYTMDIADNLSDDSALYVPDTLAHRLYKKRLDGDTVRKMHLDLMENLQTLHCKGLFHRDIKPDNILFINNRARLGDIGLVTDMATTTLRGTPGFMPAEVLAGIRSYEARDDYYALGKVIYCALTAEPVNNYPSFPADCAISDKMDLIKLYNKYCSGSQAAPAIRSRSWWWVSLAAMLVIAVAISCWKFPRPLPSADKAEQPENIHVAAPNTLQLQSILQEHITDVDIMQFYLHLQKIYEDKVLVKCSKNLPLSKEEKLLADYFANETALQKLFDSIRLSRNEQGTLSPEEFQELSQLQLRRNNLEKRLIKNLKKVTVL